MEPKPLTMTSLWELAPESFDWRDEMLLWDEELKLDSLSIAGFESMALIVEQAGAELVLVLIGPGEMGDGETSN